MKAWILRKKFSVEEKIIDFQGNHINKLGITYKAEGDRFQCDLLYQSGYTYTFYFRNQPTPKYLEMGLSPLHAHCMSSFDCLEHKYHWWGMDNLYMREKTLKAGKIAARGTVKAAVLQERLGRLNLVTVLKQRYVYSKTHKKILANNFLRLNVNGQCNNEMRHVD
eukprot:4103445-Ditylum_brightwellii.AAC.1